MENSGKYPCEICRKGVGVNSICCGSFKKWIHKRCSSVVGNIEKLVNFKCRNCAAGGMKLIDELKLIVLGNGEKVEVVEKFFYLGDVIGKGGDVLGESLWSLRCC